MPVWRAVEAAAAIAALTIGVTLSLPVQARAGAPGGSAAPRGMPGESTHGSLSSFTAAAPGEIGTIPFGSSDVGQFVRSRYTDTHGVSFDDNDLGKETSQFLENRFGVNGQGPSTLTFTRPVVGVAVDYPHGMRIEAYNAANERIFKSENQGEAGATGQFFGAIFDEVPAAVILFDPTNNIVDYDTLYLAYNADPCDADADGDGVGPCDGDCDDGDTEVGPGAAEIPADSIDNDCDGEIDEQACPGCSLREGPENPDGAVMGGAEGDGATLLHFKILNQGNPEPLAVSSITVSIDWPDATVADALFVLSTDAGCGGTGGGDGSAIQGDAGAQTFFRTDAIPAEGSLCYVLRSEWLGEPCSTCGGASARVAPEGILAASAGQDVPLGGGAVAGSLTLPQAGLEAVTQGEVTVDALSEVGIGAALTEGCPEDWVARFEVCEVPDGATGHGLRAAGAAPGEPLAQVIELGFEADPATATATLVTGDRPGAYRVCTTLVSTREAPPTCEDPPAAPEFVAQVSGLEVFALHDGDETAVVGTFITGIPAPNLFEVRVAFPPGDDRSIVRVDFAFADGLSSATAAPFVTEYDMALSDARSTLAVTAELSDGALVEGLFDVFGLPLAEWVQGAEALGASVTEAWEPEAERYAFTVRDFPDASFAFVVPSDIPLVGGEDVTGRLGFALDAHFELTRASDLRGELDVDGRLAGYPYEVEGEVFGALDPEFELLPGAFAKGRAELEATEHAFFLRTAELPILGVPIEIDTLVSGRAELTSFSITTFNQRLDIESSTQVSHLDGVYRSVNEISTEVAPAELGVAVRACAEVDAQTSYSGGGAAGLTPTHVGGAVAIRVDVTGSLFWQDQAVAGALGGATLGPFTFEDGTLGDPSGGALRFCEGEGPDGPAFYPRVALAADAEGGVVLVRTVDLSEGGAPPNPEIAVSLLSRDGPSPEEPITQNDRWELDPAVAMLSGGGALAAWTSNGASPSLTELEDIVKAQEIAFSVFDGQSWAPEAFLTDDDEADGLPQVAYDLQTDTAMVLWLHDSNEAQDPTGSSLRYALYDGQSATWGDVETVPGTTDGALLQAPRVVGDGQGRFVAAWIRDVDGALYAESSPVLGGVALAPESDDTDLMTATFDGESWTSPQALAPADGRIERSPSLALGPDGEIATLWVSRGEGGDHLELSRLQEATGAAAPPERLDSAPSFIEAPRLAIDGDGRAIVVYRKRGDQGDELFALDVDLPEEPDPAGRTTAAATISAPRPLTRAGGASWAPALAGSAEGDVWIAWARLDGDGGERGGVADRLSPGIRLAKLSGAPRVVLSGPGRVRERLGEGGLIEALELDLDLDVTSAGPLSVGARLFDRRGRILAEVAGQALDPEAGPFTATLSFDGREIGAAGVEGPFHIGDVVVADHALSPLGVDRDLVGVPVAAETSSAFAPSRLDTGRDLFVGEQDSVTMTVDDVRLGEAPTVSLVSSAMAEAMQVELEEVDPGRFEAVIQFSTEAAGEGTLLVEPSGVVRATYVDPEGRAWSSPLAWVPPSPEPFALDVEVAPARTGRIRGEGLDCPRDCYETVLAGTRVSLVAEPAEGYELATWAGACNGPGECAFLMTADTQVTARFREAAPATATPNPSTPTEGAQTPIPPTATPDPTQTEAPTDAPQATETPTQTNPTATEGAGGGPIDGGEQPGGCTCDSAPQRAGLAWALIAALTMIRPRRRRAP